MSSTTLPVCPKTGSTSPSLTVHLCLHTAPGNRECARRLCAVVAALRIHVETTPEARKCIHYVFGNRHRMRYPQFRARGLCVSSGVVEAGCKQIGDRLKRAGMRWTVAGANAIIALRCCILSGRFEDFWVHDIRVRLLPYGGIERAPIGRFLG